MKCDKLVIGFSGGLDSTHALLGRAEAMDRAGLPRSHILGFAMPGFATSKRTLEQTRLARPICSNPMCPPVGVDSARP